MWIFALPAFAADLNLALFTGDGVSESITWSATDTLTRKFGPVRVKKASRVYIVTAPANIYDSLNDVYRVEVSVCVEWTEKRKSVDRFCQKEELLAPSESAGPKKHQVAVKGKQNFSWSVTLWYTGQPPVAAGLPAEVPKPPDDF